MVEAWARRSRRQRWRRICDVNVLVNRTPTTDGVGAWRDSDNDLCLRVAVLPNTAEDAPKKGSYAVTVQYHDAVFPDHVRWQGADLGPFAGTISNAIAGRCAKRSGPRRRTSRSRRRTSSWTTSTSSIAAASGDGEYRFNARQIFYQFRPIVLEETGEELKIGNFNRIITDYEAEHGEIAGMYREPRGSIYHPHGAKHCARHADGRGI